MLHKSVMSRNLNNIREWIWDDSYDTWTFPTSQLITVQMCNMQHWSSSTLNIFSKLQEAATWRPCYCRSVFINLYIFPQCVDPPSVGFQIPLLLLLIHSSAINWLLSGCNDHTINILCLYLLLFAFYSL